MAGDSIIREQLTEAIKKAIEREREEVIKAATEDFVKRVRRIVGTHAVELANIFSVERMGAELVIRVRIEEKSDEVYPMDCDD